jgi:hypothetical protein
MSIAAANRPEGTVFGFPLKGFSLFQSMLLSLASACFTFFFTTCIAIFSLMAWNIFLGHNVNYADSYLYVGFPLSVIVLVVATPFFAVLWLRAKMRQ